jgi:hypothetical protein
LIQQDGNPLPLLDAVIGMGIRPAGLCAAEIRLNR